MNIIGFITGLIWHSFFSVYLVLVLYENIIPTTMKNYIALFCLVLVYAGCSKNDNNGGASPGGATSNKLTTGASARDFLSGNVFSSVNIQVEYCPGMQLQQSSLNNLVTFLQAHLNKAGGITITQVPVPSIARATVSISDITSFEDTHRTFFSGGSSIGVCILVVDAGYATSGVAGVAYRNTSIAVMGKSVQAASGGLGQPSRVRMESTVLNHEFGHLLGLVNNGIGMVTPHADDAHKPHCNNKNCLMYYEIENGGFTDQFDNSIPQLDANCVNDLRSAGGK